MSDICTFPVDLDPIVTANWESKWTPRQHPDCR